MTREKAKQTNVSSKCFVPDIVNQRHFNEQIEILMNQTERIYHPRCQMHIPLNTCAKSVVEK